MVLGALAAPGGFLRRETAAPLQHLGAQGALLLLRRYEIHLPPRPFLLMPGAGGMSKKTSLFVVRSRKIPLPCLAQKASRAYAAQMAKLLVLGVGNMLLTDDGVGVFAAQTLQKEEWPENVRILEAGTFTHDIFYLFEGYDTVLVLDIVHCGGKPGAIYRLTEDELVKNEDQRLSLHDIDLIDSLNMAKMLHKKRPKLLVLGMEPADFTSWNIGLSCAVQERFEDFLTAARGEIRALAEM
jgi:hydrogenase maturation protease